jgi:hypothetical protein
MSVDRDCQDAQGRDLSLPLVDHEDGHLWAGIETPQRDPGIWPALLDALSEPGRRLLWEALEEAVDATPGDPERALKVIEAFSRTMRLRRGPHFQRRVAAAWDRVRPPRGE